MTSASVLNLPPEELPVHPITVNGIATATGTALVTEVGIQVECTISDYLSKEKQVDLSVTLFHPATSRFTNQTTNIRRGSSIFFSGTLTLIEEKFYLELHNFSFIRNQTTTTPKHQMMPWSSKKSSTQASNGSSNIAHSIHSLNKKTSKSPITVAQASEASENPVVQAESIVAHRDKTPETKSKNPPAPPTPTSTKRKTRSSYKSANKAQKLADIASNIIDVGDSEEELEE